MNQKERDIFEDYHQTKDDIDYWAETLPAVNSETDDAFMRSYMQKMNAHISGVLIPHLKKNDEGIMIIQPAPKFLWGQEKSYRQGITNDRMYRVTNGLYGTGYVCMTDKNIYIFSFADLTKLYFSETDTGFINKAIMGILQGIMGERDDRTPSRKDYNWTIPYDSIVSSQEVQPKDEMSSMELRTHATMWNFYTLDEAKFLAAINLVKSGKLFPSKPQPSQPVATQTNDHAARLKKLADLLESGLISQADYQAKKTEILSSV